MSRVYYKILTSTGEFRRGYIDNTTTAQAHHLLTQRRYIVLSCTTKKGITFQRWRPLVLLDLAEICFHLAAFDEAGLPLIDALQQLQNLGFKKSITLSLQRVTQEVKQGYLLSQAFYNQPLLGHRLLLSLLQVGEKVGSFYPYLRQAEKAFRWEHDLKQSIRQALIYPIILFFFLSVLIFITIVILVPNLETHLKLVGGDLTSPLTFALIHVTSFFQTYSSTIGLVLLGLTTILWSLKRVSRRGELWLSRLFLSFPYIGQLKVHLVYLRFFQQLSTMLGNGLDLLPSLTQAANGCSNLWLRTTFYRLEALLLKGHSFTSALTHLPYLPSFISNYTQLGEKTGTLALILEKACQHEYVRIKKQLTRLTSWVQPTLVIIMGFILIWIVLAILVPLYETLSHIDF